MTRKSMPPKIFKKQKMIKKLFLVSWACAFRAIVIHDHSMESCPDSTLYRSFLPITHVVPEDQTKWKAETQVGK